MSYDTQAINKQRFSLADFDDIWVFGYGSLIYKVDFPILERADACIKGWVRRFWQGSHDHRGTPEAPGRVLTLVEQTDGHCDGVAYRVSPEVFDHLDHREKNGYLREQIEIHFAAGVVRKGIVYVADEYNDAYLGPALEKDIAEHIRDSHGPSGANSDYVLQLAKALKCKGIQDDHVFAIASHL